MKSKLNIEKEICLSELHLKYDIKAYDHSIQGNEKLNLLTSRPFFRRSSSPLIS